MADRSEHLEGAGHGAGHDRHAGHSVAMFRDKFWLSLALTIPVVLLSGDVQHWFGYVIPDFPGSDSLPAILGTEVERPSCVEPRTRNTGARRERGQARRRSQASSRLRSCRAPIAPRVW